jgi:hypothetical protein
MMKVLALDRLLRFGALHGGLGNASFDLGGGAGGGCELFCSDSGRTKAQPKPMIETPI